MLSPIELARVALLQPPLRAAVPALVADVERATSKHVAVTSGVRSSSEQQYLWDHRDTNPHPVAPPGSSKHEYGAAVDLAIVNGTDADYATMAEIAEQTYELRSGWPDDVVDISLDVSLQEAKDAWQQLQQGRVQTAGWMLVMGIVVVIAIATQGD